MNGNIRTDPEVLEHDLNQYFDDLMGFEYMAEVEKSDVWPKIQETHDEIMNSVVCENFSETKPEGKDRVTSVAWNIERGRIFRRDR